MIARRARAAWACSLLLLTASGLAACGNKASATPAVTDTWPMYQLRPDHNAVLDRPLAAGWTADMGSRINGGLAFVGDMILLDTFGHEVVALDAYSGAVRWKARVDEMLMSTPVVADGLVIVGSGHNGRLHQPGDNRFTYTPDSPGDPIWGRPEGDDVIALDAASGAERWRYHTIGEDMPSPAVVGSTVVFANGDLHAYGLSVRDGRELWKRGLVGLATMASANTVHGRVVVSVCNDAPYRCETDAVDPQTGRPAWRAPEGNSDSAPTYGDGKIFVSGVRNAAGPFLQGGTTVVSALDADTGQVRWHFSTAHARPYSEVGSAERAIAGTFANATYFQPIPNEDLLIAFDAATGHVKWRFSSVAPIKMSPVIAKGRLYAGDGAGLLYVIDARSGRLIMTRAFKRPFTVSPPIVVGSTLFVANDSVVYAIPID